MGKQSKGKPRVLATWGSIDVGFVVSSSGGGAVVGQAGILGPAALTGLIPGSPATPVAPVA